MTLAADLLNVYQAFPNLETLTLTPQGTGAVPITGVQALRRVLTLTQIAMLAGMGIDRKSLRFHLFTATLGGATPVNGDTLTDANGVKYTIDDVDTTTMGTRFAILCHPQAVNQP